MKFISSLSYICYLFSSINKTYWKYSYHIMSDLMNMSPTFVLLKNLQWSTSTTPAAVVLLQWLSWLKQLVKSPLKFNTLVSTGTGYIVKKSWISQEAADVGWGGQPDGETYAVLVTVLRICHTFKSCICIVLLMCPHVHFHCKNKYTHTQIQAHPQTLRRCLIPWVVDYVNELRQAVRF